MSHTDTNHTTGTQDFESEGVQLPAADLVHNTQPGLWDGVDLEAFGAERAALISNYRPADRMMLALGLDVSSTAKVLAALVAYHGWLSWPSRDRLAELSGISKSHLSEASKELVTAGVWAVTKTRKDRKWKYQYAFRGQAFSNSLLPSKIAYKDSLGTSEIRPAESHHSCEIPVTGVVEPERNRNSRERENKKNLSLSVPQVPGTREREETIPTGAVNQPPSQGERDPPRFRLPPRRNDQGNGAPHRLAARGAKEWAPWIEQN